MKKIAKAIYSFMGWFESTVSMTMITVTLAVTVINVFARYLFKSSIPWAQEVSGIAWTWTCMMGVSWCFRRNMHLGVDFVVEKIKPSVRRFVYIISFLILFVVFVFMTYISVIITINGGYKLTNYFNIPYSVKYVSAVIAFFNMSVYSLRYVYIAAKRPEEFLERIALEGNGLDDDVPAEDANEKKEAIEE